MAFTDSVWGYQQFSLSDTPPATYTDSDWAFASKTLAEGQPTEGVSDSAWGFQFFTLAVPHKPIRVMRADGTIGYTRVLAYTGTLWK